MAVVAAQRPSVPLQVAPLGPFVQQALAAKQAVVAQPRQRAKAQALPALLRVRAVLLVARASRRLVVFGLRVATVVPVRLAASSAPLQCH